MDSVVHARLSPEVVEQLDRRAGDEMRSRSNLVALLVTQGLAEPSEAKEGLS